MEIIIQYSNVDPPRVENCGVCGGTFSVYTTLYNRINLAHINMLFEDKYIRQVIKGCFKSGVQVSEELTFVFFKCWLINPNVKNLQKLPLKKKMDRIVDQCIQRLCANKDPEILCIKMQSLIQHEYKNREFIINKVNEENDRKLRPLLNDILDNVADLTGYKMNTYHQKIIQYIIVCNYMGDPTSPILVQEISGYYYNALNSVFNLTQLSEFENKLPSLKKNELKEISNLVCGLWLYNMDQKDGIEETLDMINTLPSAVDLLLQNIDQELKDNYKKVIMITSWILQCYKVDNEILAPIFIIRIHYATVTIKKLNDYKTILVFYLQHQKNLEVIKNDLNKCKIEFLPLLNKFNSTLKEINTFKNTNKFADDTICPELSNNVSDIWNEIRGILNYLCITCNLIPTMKQMTHEIVNIIEDIDMSTLDTIPIDNKELPTTIATYPLNPMCEWHPPTTNVDGEKNLFADGYCVVMIVETRGTLIKHDKTLGVIQYSDEWFGFASIQAALKFGTKPTFYLNHFFNLLRSKMHLLSFFNLYEQMSEKQYKFNELNSEKDKYKDAQVQTSFYPHDTSAVHKKICNTKETKQRINKEIHTINETSKVATRSAQTIDVYKSVQVQTSHKRGVGVNTLSEKGTNTNQSESHSSVRFQNKLYATIEHDDIINNLVCSATIWSNNNCQTKSKTDKHS